jgi:hypothetical protein
MVYKLGGAIQASDYNDLISGINNLFGTGTDTSGYGGNSANVTPINLPEISAGDTLNIQQWLNLRNAFADCAEHQGTTLPDGLPSVSDIETGDPALFFEKLSSAANLLELTTNKLVVDPAFIPTLTVNPDGVNSVRTSQWRQFIQHEFTVTFTDSDNARNFFNAGGSFTIDATRTGGDVSTQNTAWDSILDELQSYTFNYDDYFNLTGSLQEIRGPLNVSLYGALYSIIGLYAVTNIWTLFGQRIDPEGPNGGNGSKIRIVSSFLDNNTKPLDIVNGTFTSTVVETRYDDVFGNIVSPTFDTIVSVTNGI